MFIIVYMYIHACVRVCSLARVRERECVCVCVCVCEGLFFFFIIKSKLISRCKISRKNSISPQYNGLKIKNNDNCKAGKFSCTEQIHMVIREHY